MPLPRQTILTLEVLRADLEAFAEQIQAEWDYPVIQLERPRHNRGWLEMFFEDPGEAEIAATVLKDRPEVIGHMIREESPRDWQTFWRHHFHTTEIGDHLRIVPVWERENAPTEGPRKNIWLDPGLSFGTGDHFTTRFCLEMVDKLAPHDDVQTMLDIGTGSGILSIAAKRLGVEKIIGTDNDATALEQTLENFTLNDVEGQIELVTADILNDAPKGSFDLVCANVYTSILIEAAPVVFASAKNYIVLSGIRDFELDSVAIIYAGLGCEEIFRDGDGEWGGLAFRKKANRL